MKVFILGLLCLMSTLSSYGHNPLSARYYLEAGEPASILTINLSQDGVNKVLIDKLGQEAFNQLNQQQLKEQLAQYIRANFQLVVDNEKIELKEGGIRLGSHQTDLKFVLSPLSNELESMEIAIPAFSENESHQTIFSYNINGTTDHVILSQDNNYQSSINFSGSPANGWLRMAVIGLIGLISVLLFKWSVNRWSIPKRLRRWAIDPLTGN